jgi:hypothetical protein
MPKVHKEPSSQEAESSTDSSSDSDSDSNSDASMASEKYMPAGGLHGMDVEPEMIGSAAAAAPEKAKPEDKERNPRKKHIGTGNRPPVEKKTPVPRKNRTSAREAIRHFRNADTPTPKSQEKSKTVKKPRMVKTKIWPMNKIIWDNQLQGNVPSQALKIIGKFFGNWKGVSWMRWGDSTEKKGDKAKPVKQNITDSEDE